MVGLSVVLEAQNGSVSKKAPQVINKTTMMVTKTSSSSKISQCSAPAIPFLEQCFLCRRRLLPGKDIYMYKGDTAFCSVECRCRQIFMDEEETLRKEYCSFAAMTPASASSASSSSSSTSSTPASRHSKSARSRADASAY